MAEESVTYDEKKMEEAVLALLATFVFDDVRSWKGYDFDLMNSLFEQGYIRDPRGKQKSVVLTPEGLAKGNALADKLFAASKDKTD